MKEKVIGKRYTKFFHCGWDWIYHKEADPEIWYEPFHFIPSISVKILRFREAKSGWNLNIYLSWLGFHFDAIIIKHYVVQMVDEP